MPALSSAGALAPVPSGTTHVVRGLASKGFEWQPSGCALRPARYRGLAVKDPNLFLIVCRASLSVLLQSSLWFLWFDASVRTPARCA